MEQKDLRVKLTAEDKERLYKDYFENGMIYAELAQRYSITNVWARQLIINEKERRNGDTVSG